MEAQPRLMKNYRAVTGDAGLGWTGMWLDSDLDRDLDKDLNRRLHRVIVGRDLNVEYDPANDVGHHLFLF